jgi:hypothetical protein
LPLFRFSENGNHKATDTRPFGYPFDCAQGFGFFRAMANSGQARRRHKPYIVLFNHEEHECTKKNQPLILGKSGKFWVNQANNDKIFQNVAFCP